ncbi:MAG: hypothetical protein HXX19_12435 [Rhodoferax sp.]|nr:hypothetical protein [Rhodoferax sp.]
MTFQTFNPHADVKHQSENGHPRWLEISKSLDEKSLEQLRELNARWFDGVMGFEQTAPMLWLVNQEFTRRGVAPMWRGVPRFVRVAYAAPANPMSNVPRRLGEIAKKNLMKRWVDLEWLRVQLGSSHVSKFRGWQDAFADDIEIAVLAFTKVNAIWSHGGGKLGTKPAHDVVDRLSVPKIHRLGLTGLIDRDAGELVRNMEKRLRATYRPLLEAQIDRPIFPLTKADVERRLLYCQAIDLAVGSPTNAAKIFQWMTGESVSKQTMHEMRCKIADQCDLKTRAWRSPAAPK